MFEWVCHHFPLMTFISEAYNLLTTVRIFIKGKTGKFIPLCRYIGYNRFHKHSLRMQNSVKPSLSNTSIVFSFK